ncbi:PAS domain-containing protein [Geomesophilobacter sediminis]|uniref:histidine kinase n=1 Tax=Geomesophilobacter sediminis TaxID=2798584 RepID=A0A8J7JLC8_9BACT|nr:PAS domain S-box protein [Geomesophilobacter sediminis]MBJ6725160.1 PAS domain S-box protein [Geomesophilobacter sediminis]
MTGYDKFSRAQLIQMVAALKHEKNILVMTQGVALRESEERYRRMIETANEGIWEFDAKGNTRFVNTRMGILLDYHADEMVGRPLFDFVAADDKDDCREKLAQLRKGSKVQFELRLLGKDNGPVWTIVNASPVLDREGHCTGSVWMLTDIGDRKRVEAALEKSEAYSRAMIRAFDGLTYVCSAAHRIEFLNERFKERIGHDATGELCYQALHNLNEVCPWCVNARVLAGESVRWEVKSPLDNRWYHVSNTPIYHADGTVSKQAMITDITDRKKAEERLAQLKTILEQAGDLAHFGTWAWDSATGLFTTSEKWRQLHGAGPGVNTLAAALLLVHPEDRAAVGEALRQAVAASAPVRLEYRVGSEEGGRILMSGELVRQPGPKPTTLCGVAHKITG